MNTQLERIAIPARTPAAVINKPVAQFKQATPPAFRRQERFWKEVKNRITERNPAVRDLFERLY